ncbi:Tetratricopeptide repeat-containing protein [Actinacidiphila glaucinigra]|uniref:Tetratricopeptide repeat-containing protein n=1 Tax=Actinacidiphila glaucinigra TaxID=235986 RepID=A0A239NQA9_9ACTN|nr:Tetratricopeptide repeat-containing protein [Actinacidiphila glaucinigra]
MFAGAVEDGALDGNNSTSQVKSGQDKERPDPLSVATTAEFVQALKALKVWAGDPSLQVLSRRTKIPTSTLADALNPGRRRLPPLDTVRSVASACGAAGADLERWEKAWRGLRQTDGRRLEAEGEPVRNSALTAWSETGGYLPRQLPPDANGFYGRTAALSALDATLRDAGQTALSAIPIAIVTGSAGVGKTALAVHWAHAVAKRFPDGQLYVNLRGHSMDPALTATQALSLLLQSLGVPPERIPVDPELQAGMYRSLLAGRRMLVLLDNAVDVAQARPLLPSSPGCHVVITSRDALTGLVAREGARRCILDVLEPQEATVLLRNLIGAERADAEEDSVAELGRLCVHLPLALRIVGANLANHPSRDIAHYVSELKESDLLSGLEVEGDPEMAVAAAFDLSYMALSSAARHMFRLLALVSGPDISREAAAVLAGIPVLEASRILQGLASAHLLEEHEPSRYRRHDLLSLYAHQRVQAEETPEDRDCALERVLAWYVSRINVAADVAYPTFRRLTMQASEPVREKASFQFRNEREALVWLSTELPNLVAAVNHAAAHKPHHRRACHLADALRGYFTLHRRDADWVVAVRSTLAAAHDDGRSIEQAAMHLCLGTALGAIDDDRSALEEYTLAAHIYAELGDVQGHSVAENNMGNCHLKFGQLKDAARHFHLSVQLADDPITQVNLALVNRDIGRLSEALSWAERAAASAEAIGDHEAYRCALTVLSSIETRLGRPESAHLHATAVLNAGRSIGNRATEADALAKVAAACIQLDRPTEALGHALQALELIRDGVARTGDEQALISIVHAHLVAAPLSDTIALAERVLAEFQERGFRLAAARTQVLLGRALTGQDASAAAEHWEHALAVMIDVGAADAEEVRALLQTL